MSKWNLIVDVGRCDNCRLCFLAVKDEYIGNDFPGVSAAQPVQGHNWLDIKRKERGTYPIVQARFLPVMCNHCDDAPCIKAARDGAVRKREDGRSVRAMLDSVRPGAGEPLSRGDDARGGVEVLGNEGDNRRGRPGGDAADSPERR